MKCRFTGYLHLGHSDDFCEAFELFQTGWIVDFVRIEIEYFNKIGQKCDPNNLYHQYFRYATETAFLLKFNTVPLSEEDKYCGLNKFYAISLKNGNMICCEEWVLKKEKQKMAKRRRLLTQSPYTFHLRTTCVTPFGLLSLSFTPNLTVIY